MGNTTNLITNKTLFIACDCRSEILMIEYDHEIKIADLAIFENYTNYSHKMSLWQRLRYCFRVLFQKKPYSDQIVLNNKQLSDLKNFLCTLDLAS
jgi:MoaA/NifB/PqqE/SkfB family radical SAM enzyme